ncbi:MAG: hypothetical protein DMG58_34755 [Acidobacteria bacterium]|nr:MAG: hypothetical protein DMG58_34755 [Acidobacteriota bacterium]
MRKLFRLLYVLVWSFGVVSSFAAAKVIMLAAPKGSNPAGSYARVQKGTDYSKGVAAWKAQNHLTTTTNQRLVREKAGVGGGFGRPGYKNGTMDTVPYFNSWFITGGRNSVYTYSMVGKSPKAGGTTLIENRILPLFIALLDERGNALYSFDPTGSFLCGAGSDVNLTVQSPLYDASTTYPGGAGLPADTGQLVDTNQRAEFHNVRTADWHTLLNVPQNGECAVSIYGVGLDPSAWAYLIDKNNDIVGEAVDINVMAVVFEEMLIAESASVGLPNHVVPILLTDAIAAYDSISGSCCALGFHSAQQGFINTAGILVWAWASFLPANNNIWAPLADIAVVSHEVTELFNNPFVNTNVAPWVDGAVLFAQGNLETADVIEAMNANDVIYPVTLNTPSNGVYTYHPQNEALLGWFTRTPLEGGAYSWPNTQTLGQCQHVPSATPNWCYGEGSAGFFFGPPY